MHPTTGPDSSPTRAAGRQLLWLGLAFVAGFAMLLAMLGWLARYTGGAQTTGEAVDPATSAITLAYPFEPPQLDGTRASDVSSSFVLGHVMEGLLRLDEHG